MPQTYAHIRDAIASGKPMILTYDSDLDARDERRGQALKGIPCEKCMVRDEYPFASTFEGGPGASVRLVPAWEQHFQGAQIGALVRINKLVTGDKIIVRLIPKNPPFSAPEPNYSLRMIRKKPLVIPLNPKPNYVPHREPPPRRLEYYMDPGLETRMWIMAATALLALIVTLATRTPVAL
jgi:hypothetical protein